MSFGIQMCDNTASLLRTSDESSLFPRGTVLFFGFSKGDKDAKFSREFERTCEQYGIGYERLSFEPTTFWLYGESYAIFIDTKADFEKSIPVIEAFGGSTDRYLLKSADVRLTTIDEVVMEYEEMVLLGKSSQAYFDTMVEVK